MERTDNVELRRKCRTRDLEPCLEACEALTLDRATGQAGESNEALLKKIAQLEQKELLESNEQLRSIWVESQGLL